MESFKKMYKTHGLATQKAKRYPVLSQLTAFSETPKYSAEVVDMEEKVSHLKSQYDTEGNIRRFVHAHPS